MTTLTSPSLSPSRRFWPILMSLGIGLAAVGVHQLLLLKETKVMPQAVTRSIPFGWEDLQLSRNAWRYFTNNRLKTGLVSSGDQFPATTMWDIGSQLAGMTAARELDLLPPQEFDQWMHQTLATLAKLPLYRVSYPIKPITPKP